jgi:hypothetical protein
MIALREELPMFELLEENEPKKEEPTNYTGVFIGLITLPALIYFDHIGQPGMGLKVSISLGMLLFAIGVRWELRKRIWFWVVIVAVLALHFLLVRMVPWPHMTVNRITLLPIGFADLMLDLGIIAFVEKFIVKAVPIDDES